MSTQVGTLLNSFVGITLTQLREARGRVGLTSSNFAKKEKPPAAKLPACASRFSVRPPEEDFRSGIAPAPTAAPFAPEPSAAKPRTQTQVAISADSKTWFLLGASPDLRAQIEATPELHPRDGHAPVADRRSSSAQRRHRPRARTAPAARTAAASRVRDRVRPPHSYRRQFHVRHAAARSRSVDWTICPRIRLFAAQSIEGEDSGLRCRALSLGTHFPAYVSAESPIGTHVGRSRPWG